MTKSELIARLALRNPQVDVKDAESLVNTIVDAMKNALRNGDRVEIRHFGSFSLSHRKLRASRNPKSGKKISVPAKSVPHFKAGKTLRQRVDAPENSNIPTIVSMSAGRSGLTEETGAAPATV